MDKRLVAATERVDNIMEQLLNAGADMEDPVSIYHVELPSNLSYNSGACRIVVWDNNYDDFVVKFPISNAEEKFCRREVELYARAQELHIDEAFAWCDCIYEPNTALSGIGVYAMEYLDCDEEEISSKTFDSAFRYYCEDQGLDPTDEKVRKDYEWDVYDCDEANDYLYDLFMTKLDEKKRTSVDEFISDNDINDLHAGNMGFRNDMLVICDYAGYGW